MRRLFWIVGLTSLSIIAFQLALMRYLSIVQFHHYAYMIISIALLGFGASGVLLFLFRNFFLKNFEYSIFSASVLLFILILYSTKIIDKFPFNPFLLIWDIGEGSNILLFYLTLFLPFFSGALILGLSFMKYTHFINRLYSYNLIGSAVGGVGIILVMFVIQPHQLYVVVALSLLISIALSISLLKQKILPLLILGFCLVLMILTIERRPTGYSISEYKGLRKALDLPEVEIINELFSPEGWVLTLSSPALRYAPGLSLSYEGDIPSQIGVFNDGELSGTILKDTKQTLDFLNKSTLALPYLFKNEKVLIVGAGTGLEIIRAIQSSTEYIIGIEVNTLIHKLAGDFLNNFLADDAKSKYKILNVEGRAFLKQTDEKFDLIYFPVMEGFSSSAAGYYSLFENYLFTTEAISDAIQKLNKDGFLCINTWTNYPPRHAIKIFSLVVDSFRKSNIMPVNNLIAIRSWSTVTLLAKKSPLTRQEIERIKNFCDDNYFDLVYYPGIQENETNKYNVLSEDLYHKYFKMLLSEERFNFEKNYIFNIKSPTDDQPYFSNFIRINNLLWFLSESGRENLPLYEWGYLLLWITFLQILFLCGLLILFPMLFMKKQKFNFKNSFKVLLFFSGIGLGFMLIEILMIQKFILFLSHPIYSVSMVISSLLLFAGLGSLLSVKITSNKYFTLKTIASGLIFLLIIYFFFLPGLFDLLIHLPIALKYVIAFFMIGPLAFLMGIFFPVGIRNLSYINEHLIPWAWGINGAVSVLSSVVAPIISIELGFQFLLLLSCIAYSVIILINEKFD